MANMVAILGDVVGKRKRKFYISCNLWLLTKDRPITNFEAMRLLFTIMCKHWNDNVKWGIANFMHYIIFITTKVIIHVTKYFVISCDEVMTI